MPKRDDEWLYHGFMGILGLGGKKSGGGGSHKSNKPRQESTRREKICPGYNCFCSNTIHWKSGEDAPTYCGSCRNKQKNANRPQNPQTQRSQQEKRPQQQHRTGSNWLDKPCKTQGCTNMVHYLAEWPHPPSYCKSCKLGFSVTKLATDGKPDHTTYSVDGIRRSFDSDKGENIRNDHFAIDGDKSRGMSSNRRPEDWKPSDDVPGSENWTDAQWEEWYRKN